jgi:DNA modification methylase
VIRIFQGDCREVMATLPDASVHCCVTSPPYFGLRDYGHVGQIGQEPTPDEYVAQLVDVFRAVRRVLRDDGTLWLNLGDSYTVSAKGGSTRVNCQKCDGTGIESVLMHGVWPSGEACEEPIKCETCEGFGFIEAALKPKDLIGIPWRVAFALQADGWYLRQDIVWHKPNPMPESVTDRCTKAHEYVFLMSKGQRYCFDAEAISEPAVSVEHVRKYAGKYEGDNKDRNDGGRSNLGTNDTRNKRSVWTIPTQPFAEAHFATMSPELAETCIKAGCPAGGTVLDPFGGAGTTGLVADRMQRDAILCELNPEYIQIAKRRIHGDAPLFADVEAA